MINQLFIFSQNEDRVSSLTLVSAKWTRQTLFLPIVYTFLAKRMRTAQHDLHGFIDAYSAQIVVIPVVGALFC